MTIPIRFMLNSLPYGQFAFSHPSLVHAPLRLLERTQASTNATPFSPSFLFWQEV